MKRFLLIISALCVASLSIFLFTGCPTATTEGYYIKFKLDGVDKNFDKGLTDIEVKPFGVLKEGSTTEIFANPNEVTSVEIIEHLYFYTSLTDVGTESVEVIVVYETETSVVYSSSSTPATVTFSTYESEGGVIEGTFSATVNNVTYGDKEITEGEFRVKRLDNDTMWRPVD